MITIRSSKNSSQVALISLEVTVTTPRNVYTISSDGSMTDSGSSFGEGLFGGISWPRSRFRIPEGVLLDQQMFLPDDRSAVALSWALIGDEGCAAQLVARPFFPVAGRVHSVMSASNLIWKRMSAGLPGCRMYEDRDSLRTLMANIAMNRFGRPIAFASKRQLRLRRKT